MVERRHARYASVPGAVEGVRFEPLETGVVSCVSAGAGLSGVAPRADEAATDPSGAVGSPRVEFHPTAPMPVAPESIGAGAVTLYLDADDSALLSRNAALAVLLKTRPAQAKRLLIEVSDAFAHDAGGAPRLISKISTAQVWRTGVAASGGRLRDWVLLLQECRSAYNTTAVAAGGADPALQQRLATLADRTVVVSSAGARSLGQAHRRLRWLRDQGVHRCECLWLDAA